MLSMKVGAGEASCCRSVAAETFGGRGGSGEFDMVKRPVCELRVCRRLGAVETYFADLDEFGDQMTGTESQHRIDGRRMSTS